MDKTHPEGLSFAPKGHGFTDTVDRIPSILPLLLLTQRTINTVRRNHPGEWDAAFDAMPRQAILDTTVSATPGPRVPRRICRFTDDERARLATLAVLREHGLFPEDDGTVTVGDRA